MRRRSLTVLRRLDLADEVESAALWIASDGDTRAQLARTANRLAALIGSVVRELRGNDEPPLAPSDTGSAPAGGAGTGAK